MYIHVYITRPDSHHPIKSPILSWHQPQQSHIIKCLHQGTQPIVDTDHQ